MSDVKSPAPDVLAKQIADAASDMCEIARIVGEWRNGPKQSLTAIREIRAALSPASPPAEALPSQTSGAEALHALSESVEDFLAQIEGGDVRDNLEWEDWDRVFRPAIKRLRELMKGLSAALAKPASEPAGGGVTAEAIARWKRDSELLSAIQDECWDVRFTSTPNADAGDYNVNIEIVGHFMAEPQERVVGENYNEDLRAALEQAMTAEPYPPARPVYDEPAHLSSPASSSPAEAVEKARAEEREACARMAFAYAAGKTKVWRYAAQDIASAIRSGATEETFRSRKLSSPGEELHGPFGHLVIALGLDEEHWRIEDEPVDDADHVSLPMFTKTDPFKHLPEGSEWPRPAEAEALQDGVEDYAQRLRQRALLAMYHFADIASREPSKHVRSREYEAADQAAVDAITKLARLSSAPAQEDGSKDLGWHPRGSGQNATEVEKLHEALARAQAWHESEDKALSKSGRADADYYWRRSQHREQIDMLRSSLSAAEYDAAWGRINTRDSYEDEPSDAGSDAEGRG